MKKKTLTRILFEEMEPDQSGPLPQVSPAQTEQPQNVSLDQKVDHFLVQYEKESMPNASPPPGGIPVPGVQQTQEGTLRGLFKLLFEADDEPAPEAPGDSGDDLGLPDPSADAAPPPSDEPDTSVPSPKINVNNFATRLARLVNNFEALLDPQTTILNRAQTYIAKNYNAKVAKELMIIMETQFGLTPKQKSEKDQEYSAPMAVGAAGDMIGAGGGGT